MTVRPHRRLVAVVAAASAVAVLSGACARRDTDEKKVLGWLDKTADLSNRFVYNESIGGQSVVVRGLVEDDFRFKARLTVNSADILDEVVSDDAMAVRFLEPSLLPQFVRSGGSASVTLDALTQRKWVLDKAGAPPVGLPVTDNKFAGVDPVADSLAVLAYARQAITEGQGLTRFNPESIDYRPKEDPFPTPQDKSGIDRYDVKAPAFPKPDQVSTNVDQPFAALSHFRKLSVYVKDGKVIQVRERIAADGKVLEKFSDYMKAFTKPDKEAAKQVTAILKDYEGEQRALLLLQLLNAGLQKTGRPTIHFRTMTYELRDLGGTVQVAMPSDVVESKLDFFGVNAVDSSAASAASAASASKASAGNTTTTTGP
jgi:hypothetical protein